MDYNFFLLKIDQLSADEHAQLVELAQAIDYSHNNTYWNMDRHRGIDGRIMPRRTSHPLLDRLMARPDWCDVFPDRRNFINYEVDRLHPEGHIAEHTDGYSIKERCWLTHRVHIPLTGRATYSFRRSENDPWTIETMEHGGVYLFNNAVLHSVSNLEPSMRLNLMLNIDDPRLASKAALYDKFDIAWRY